MYNLYVTINYADSNQDYTEAMLTASELARAIETALQSVTATSFVFTVVKSQADHSEVAA